MNNNITPAGNNLWIGNYGELQPISLDPNVQARFQQPFHEYILENYHRVQAEKALEAERQAFAQKTQEFAQKEKNYILGSKKLHAELKELKLKSQADVQELKRKNEKNAELTIKMEGLSTLYGNSNREIAELRMELEDSRRKFSKVTNERDQIKTVYEETIGEYKNYFQGSRLKAALEMNPFKSGTATQNDAQHVAGSGNIPQHAAYNVTAAQPSHHFPQTQTLGTLAMMGEPGAARLSTTKQRQHRRETPYNIAQHAMRQEGQGRVNPPSGSWTENAGGQNPTH